MVKKIQAFRERFRSSITVTVSILTLIALFFGAFQFIDTTYAENRDLVHLSHKVDIKILDDRINNLQQRIWSLQDRKQTMIDQEVIGVVNEQIRESEKEKERLEKELDVVISNYKDIETKK